MKLIILYVILLSAFVLFNMETALSQNKIYFEYDLSGNRAERTIVLPQPKSATISRENQLDEFEDQLGTQQIRIYPNPTKGLLKIDFPSLSEPGMTLRVHDSQGRLLINKPAREIGNELNLYKYPSGLYILTIQRGSEKRVWKINKE